MVKYFGPAMAGFAIGAAVMQTVLGNETHVMFWSVTLNIWLAAMWVRSGKNG